MQEDGVETCVAVQLTAIETEKDLLCYYYYYYYCYYYYYSHEKAAALYI